MARDPAAGPGSPSRVGVVIPAHDGGDDLLDCLASVSTSRLVPAAVVVVDNASRDGAVDRAAQRFPSIEVLRNHDNRGFAAACNQGIDLALERGHDFVLLLNQDACLEPPTLESMVELATRHPRAGVIGAKTLSTSLAPDGAPLLLYNGAWRTRLPLWQRIPGVGRSSRGSASQPVEVDYVWGHGMLLRASAVRETGALDGGFFMYFEDLDLCRRMRQAGWEIWCDARVTMSHRIGDASRAHGSQPWRWELKVDSGRRFYRKHFAQPSADLLWCATTAREAVSLLRNGHFAATGHLLRAWWRTARGPARGAAARRVP